MNKNNSNQLTLMKDNMPICDKNQFLCTFKADEIKEALLALTQKCEPLPLSDTLSNEKKLPKQPPARHSENDAKHHNAMMVNNYNATIQRIKSMHHYCENPIPWNQIATLTALTLDTRGPSESRAYSELNAYKPNAFQRMTKKHQWKKEWLEEKLLQAKTEDQNRITLQNHLIELAKSVADGQANDYFRVLLLLNPFNDLLALGSQVTVICHNKDLLEITFNANCEEVVPKRILSLSPTQNVISNNMTDAFYHELVQDYICSCALRIARELFAITPVKQILVHAEDKQVDSDNGNHYPLLSVLFTRSKLLDLDFLNIDPSDSMANFEHHMDLRPSKGLNPVEKLKP